MRELSNMHEKYIAKIINGKVVVNSGATAMHKGDVIIEDTLLVDCKTVAEHKKSISIKEEWLDKVREEALGMGINPNHGVLAVNFGPDEKNYFVVPEKFFIELLDVYKKS